MNAEERTLRAIKLTRRTLLKVLDDPLILVGMVVDDVVPEQVEDAVTEILKYLEKTGEEEKPSG